MSVLASDTVVQDDQVRSGSIDVTTDREGLNGRVLLAGVSKVRADIDGVSSPARRIGGEPSIRSEVDLERAIGRVRGREPVLDTSKELLRHLLSLRHDDDTDVRVITDPVRHIVHRDRRGLRMLRWSVDQKELGLSLDVHLVLMQVAGLSPLKAVHPLKMMVEQLRVQVLTAELLEVRHVVPCGRLHFKPYRPEPVIRCTELGVLSTPVAYSLKCYTDFIRSLSAGDASLDKPVKRRLLLWSG